jgi:dTDP-4-amino-4,6-dideoxygalactose transaminase
MAEGLALTGGVPVRTSPFVKWPVWDQHEVDALSQVIASGKWNRWAGDRVRTFEKLFSDYSGAGYVLAVSSGTGALESALAGVGLQPGDEVILPAYGFTSPVGAVLRHGGIPVFVDVDPQTYNLDPECVARALSKRTRAILPIHLLGRPADLDRLGELAETHNVALVEDAALAAGSRWRGRQVGTIGEVGIFSCQAEKNLNCGEGGIVVTSDEWVWRHALSYSDYWKGELLPQPNWDALTSGFRMTEFQAAILLVQLQRLDSQSDTRQSNGRLLDAELSQIPGISVRPSDERVTRDSHGLYMMRFDSAVWDGVHRDGFVKALQAEGIPAVTGYRRPLYANLIFQDPQKYMPSGHAIVSGGGSAPDYNQMVCPVAERACAEEAVWLRQQTLLCSESDARDILRAITKLWEHRVELLRLANSQTQ